MKAFVALCAIFALAQGASLSNRIVGGKDADIGQFPFIASLRNGNSHFCGATVIGSRAILTAAHCKVYPIANTNVVVGTNKQNDNGARRYKVESFTIHEKYNPSTITNDVAVIILTEDIEFSDLVQAVPLASRPISDNDRLTSAGWGLDNYPGSVPNDLQWMQMNVVSHSQCAAITGQPLDGKICTLESKGHGICSGDSGGPLINDQNEIVGVTSAAYLCALGLPDFFTDVYYFKDWINAHANL